MLRLLPETGGDFLAVRAEDRLADADYREFLVPRLEAIIRQYGKARMLCVMAEGFRGWTVGAAWDDAVFGIKHRNDFAKLAVVGAPSWVEWAVKLGARIMSGEVRGFPANDAAAALDWVRR
jgi:SpoIIAA-like